MKKTLLIILTLMLFNQAYSFFWYKTSSTEIGVKLNKMLPLFGRKAVRPQIAKSSQFHIWIPFIEEFYKFDTSIQSLEMTFSTKSGDINRRDDLLFKTIDGNDISLDVIIQYHILADKAPEILQFVAKNNQELKFKIVRIIARSIPRDIFGELKTEEFYEQANREAKAIKVKKVLNELVNPYGVVIDNVLPKDYRFNPAYQQAIEDKKVADQLVEKNRSDTKATREEYLRKLEEAKGEVNKLIARVNGEFRKEKLKADAYYDQQKSIAKAIEFEGYTQAKSIKAEIQALSSRGGRVKVKLAIAEALKNKKIMILPSDQGLNLRTLDFNSLLEVYGMQSVTKKK